MSRSAILIPGEDIRFQSFVSASSLKRRPSRLLSITTKKKTKPRMLLLTNNRLICAKVEKGGKVLTIRGEWTIPKVTAGTEKSNTEKHKPDKEKEKKKSKDSANQTIISVEPKGEKEFVVLTVSQFHHPWVNSESSYTRQATKSLSFIAEDSILRSKWVSNIQRAINPATATSAAA